MRQWMVSDVMSAAARRMRKPNDRLRVYTRGDDAIKQDVVQQVLRRKLWIDPPQVRVEVDAGVVTLTGQVGRLSTAAMVERLTGEVPGVQHVINKIAYEFDDSALVRSRVGRTHPFSADPFGP